ncbi:MAG: hypothetical protein K2X47_12755 [Bdellovibrionales bacterium]|nr:hypothetical protein [Bdellovibrionales bacterium]
MKKAILATAAGILLSGSAFAEPIVNLDIINYALSSAEVTKALTDRSVTQINVDQQNKSTTWTYVLNITSTESGLGLNGPSSHPCFTKVIVKTIGAIAGTVMTRPQVETICAMNAPRGFGK